MLWKLLGLQKVLDTLFDDGWCAFRFVVGAGCSYDDTTAPQE